jgi:prepilin-type N-terminal cleavage/methylation domain-containing protein
VDRRDDGFTLVELLIVVSILGIIMGAIAASFIVSLRVTSETQDRLSESHDADLTSAYFASDFQSAESLDATCGPSSGSIMRFSWTDPGSTHDSDDDEARAVGYVVETQDGERRLNRYLCIGTDTSGEMVTLARLLSDTDPLIECFDEQGLATSCSDDALTARLTVHVCARDATGACALPEYVYALKAARRISLGITQAFDDISFESFTTNMTNPTSGNASTTLTIDKPGGTAEGDFLLAQITFEKGTDATIIAPLGWTLERRTDRLTDLGQAVYWKVAGPAELGPYSWIFSQSVKAAGGIIRYTGVDTDTPVVQSSGNAPGNSSTLTANSVNAEEGSRLVAFFGFKKAGASFNLSAPTGMTSRYQFQNPQDVTMLAADELRTSAGSTGNRVSNATTSGNPENQAWVAHLVALRPAAIP